MGANSELEIIRKSDEINDKTIVDKVSHLIDQALWDNGHGGYTGTIAEANGVALQLDKTVEVKTPRDWEAEGDFIDAVAEKWGPAVVCRATQDGEDIGYVVCGTYSS